MPRNSNLIGQRFSRIQVIGDSGERKWGQKMWSCICDCNPNKIFLVCGGNLKSGHTRSCGCLSRESSIINGKKQRKYNTYIEHENCLEGKDASGKSFFIDKEDYKLVEPYYWIYSRATKYWQTSWRENKERKFLKLHQVICPNADGVNFVPDHIDRNPSNNRRNNLKIRTRQENSINSGLQSNNTSGFVGVTWRGSENKWRASISKEKSKYRIVGRFKTKEEAIIARLKAEKEYYGEELAPQRHLFKEYGI